jgi:hypothetical protein
VTEKGRSKNSEDGHGDSLKGKTLKVYRYMYKAGRVVRVNDIQRALNLSSPSVAQYHVKKLLQFGLIREEQEGYAIDKVILSNVIRFRRVSMPYQAAYLAFFVASLIVLLTVLRPSGITAPYFFALLVIAVAAVIAVYEAIKTLRRL